MVWGYSRCRFTLGSDAHTPAGLERLEALQPLLQTLALTTADFAPITRRNHRLQAKICP